MSEQEWFYAWLAAWGVCGGLIAAIFRTWNPFHLVGGGFIASLVVGIGVFEWQDWRGASESSATKAAVTESAPSVATTAPISPSEMTFAHKVAIVSAGTYLPPDHLKVKRTRYLLQSLSEKSGEPEERVGDMAATTRNLIEERYGKRYTVIQLLELANSEETVRDGTIGLQQYWALVATLAADL
jgi:hypothetical protein